MTAAGKGGCRLVGDIGGTNARFALARDGTVGEATVLATSDHPTFEAAIRAFLDTLPGATPVDEAAFAIAGPITGDRIALTNHAWSFSLAQLKASLGYQRVIAVNDFAANALSLPYLAAGDLARIGGGEAVPGRPLAILGPGTGLGVSGLLPVGSQWIALSGEGGHVTAPAASVRESGVIGRLRESGGHVSAEELLSGRGLVNIYRALAALDGVAPSDYAPAQLTDPAVAERDPLCREALATFCAVLGTVAGDLALTLGAQGGVFIAGGIVPRLGPRFAASPFRARFEAKGRFSAYLAAIPTFVILHRAPALVGLANLP